MNLADLLDREHDVELHAAINHLQALVSLWNAQAPLCKSPVYSLDDLDQFAPVATDLDKLHHWFNPTATGKRLRASLESVAAVPQLHVALGDLGDLVEPIGNDRALIAPEGRVAMWVLATGVGGRDAVAEAHEKLWIPPRQAATAWKALADIYCRWNRQRIRNVIGLLQDETATLRPSVIGLLLVLLINRNTSRDRRLPAPAESRQSNDISEALAQPALAFVNALSGERDSRADPRGLDLYRGWAIGEVARRLGSGLHRDDGLWIDETFVVAAEDRLIRALINRPASQLGEVEPALDVLLNVYEQVRPRLTALGVAYERPSATRRLTEKIRDAVQTQRHAPPHSPLGETQ